jgi:hypothetical protein
MPFVYAAKFVCGSFGSLGTAPAQEGPVEPGNYATAINIHNPSPRDTVTFIKKAVLMYSVAEKDIGFETPRRPGEPVRAELQPDWGMEIDGPDSREVLLRPGGPPAPDFIKGWVIIESPEFPLDVVAVYTARALGESGAVSIAMDRVTPTQV